MNEEITIGLTSCGRINLLKKTVTSLGKNINLDDYKKIIVEDSNNRDHIIKIKEENKNGFLKGREVIYTHGSKQHGALKALYDRIHTPYTFHCEDDWLFKKVNFDFFEISVEILKEYTSIGLVQIRDFFSDGGLKVLDRTETERYNELFSSEILSYKGIKFVYARFDELGDKYRGFSYNPGMRRTSEVKKVMFGFEDHVDERAIGERYKKLGLVTINLQDGIVVHIGDSLLSTKIYESFEKGFISGMRKIITDSIIYRSKLVGKWLNNFTLKIYKYLDNIIIIRYIMDIIAGIKINISAKKVSLDILQNKEGIEEMNISHSWFTEKKPLGISGVARLKNADTFLEEAIRSHIPYLDEIILIDNQSTDTTKDICKRLLAEYPDKIKYFEYVYEVYPLGIEKSVETNSIHSLAYYYNWSFSKSSYRYVMKVDDDNILIPKKRSKIREYILSVKPNKYVAYRGFNLMFLKNDIGICKNDMYSGRYGDHGIYPVSEFTYYTQNQVCEQLHHNLFFKRFFLSFFHLKYLKKNFGLHNCIDTNIGKNRYNEVTVSEVILNNNDVKEFLNSRDLNFILLHNQQHDK